MSCNNNIWNINLCEICFAFASEAKQNSNPERNVWERKRRRESSDMMKWIIIILNEKISVCVRRVRVCRCHETLSVFPMHKKFLNTMPTGFVCCEWGSGPIFSVHHLFWQRQVYDDTLSFGIHAIRGGKNNLHHCIVKSLSVRSELASWFHSAKSIWSKRCEEVTQIHAALVPVTSSCSTLLTECACTALVTISSVLCCAAMIPGPEMTHPFS